MRRTMPPAVGLLFWILVAVGLAAEERPVGRGLSEANKERLALDEGPGLADWYNGSPTETTLTRCEEHGRGGVKFANRVDHTAGEKNYPIGWPRAGKELKKAGRTDWSAWDLFECWIYVESSCPELPGTPLGLSFNHSGTKRATHLTLKEVAKDRWVHIVVPIARLEKPHDVQRIQFHIAEANYQHGDRVDFLISGLSLSRYIDPVVTELELERRLVYAGQRELIAGYRLTGRDRPQAQVELTLTSAGAPRVPPARAAAEAQGEVVLPLPAGLEPGRYEAELAIRDRAGRLIDRKTAPLRVVESPW